MSLPRPENCELDRTLNSVYEHAIIATQHAFIDEEWVKLPDTEELDDWFNRMFVGTHTLSELAQKLTEWLQGERE